MRQSTYLRKTTETDITIGLNLDGSGESEIQTGVGLLDHMMTAFACHSRMDLSLKAEGDLHVDNHHTIEDAGLVLGYALNEALGDRKGIRRFATAFAPLDEALARVVIDLSGRPYFIFEDLCENIPNLAGDVMMENLRSIAMAGRMTLHIDLIRGLNLHHAIEAIYKSLAMALREAVIIDSNITPSTKGIL
ncbi:imidazoleglycerol-phosphate dehydratase HisB [bacterium]|nr:imidazoleglycerol-phosphate dehydratase HisB [bacterium]